MKIAIIIGADRAGKSTLVGEFEKAGWISKHFDPPKRSPYGEYLDYAKWLSEKGDPNGKYVIDRYMYCEFAYSKHYGRSTDMTIERMNEIEDILLALDPTATVVYCETDLESNWERIQDEGKKEFRSIKELYNLRSEYKRVLLNSKLDLITYNFETGYTPKDVLVNIETKKVYRENNDESLLRTVDMLCRLSERCQAVAKFSEWRGSWYEKSEQYADAACDLANKILHKGQGENNG